MLQTARVIRSFEAEAGAADGRTLCQIYVNTPVMLSGIFSLSPGDWFEPGNHPFPEPYLVLDGTVHVGSPDTGQLVQVDAGDAIVIPRMIFHTGYNFNDTKVRILFMIPRDSTTDEMKADPVYGNHYSKFREPVVLRPDSQRRDPRHDSWAQPGFRVGDTPPSALDHLQRWPVSGGQRPDPVDDVDIRHIAQSDDWLHLITGHTYSKHFLTSLAWSTPEFQFGTISLPAGRVTDPLVFNGERTYYPMAAGDQLMVTLTESGAGLLADPGDAIWIPAGVEHMLQNPGARTLKLAFATAAVVGEELW